MLHVTLYVSGCACPRARIYLHTRGTELAQRFSPVSSGRRSTRGAAPAAVTLRIAEYARVPRTLSMSLDPRSPDFSFNQLRNQLDYLINYSACASTRARRAAATGTPFDPRAPLIVCIPIRAHFILYTRNAITTITCAYA